MKDLKEKMLNAASLAGQFNALRDDFDKWLFVRDHQDSGIVIMLDNDDTYGLIEIENPVTPDDPFVSIFQFDHYLGSSDGVVDLLSAIDINWEFV